MSLCFIADSADDCHQGQSHRVFEARGQVGDGNGESISHWFQWIGLGENLQENPIFDGKNPWVSCKFSQKPIHWWLAMD